MLRFLIRFLNLPSTLRIKLYPHINRLILKANGAVFGKNLQIPGKVSWLIEGSKLNIGDNFYLYSGNGGNPIASNL